MDLSEHYTRLRETLAHVINRVSTEGRDDEQGMIFTTGKVALDQTPDHPRGAVAPSVERIEAVIRAARARRRSDLSDTEIAWIAAAVSGALEPPPARGAV